MGILFYELYKKCHPFEESKAKDVIKLVKIEFDGLELNEGILDDIIKGCLKQKPSERLTLPNINRMVKNIVDLENINIEQADVRRTSYGLVSPNKALNAVNNESNTEKLDDEESEEQKRNNEINNGKFFQILNDDGFSNETYSEIIYNHKLREGSPQLKGKLRCVNTASK